MPSLDVIRFPRKERRRLLYSKGGLKWMPCYVDRDEVRRWRMQSVLLLARSSSVACFLDAINLPPRHTHTHTYNDNTCGNMARSFLGDGGSRSKDGHHRSYFFFILVWLGASGYLFLNHARMFCKACVPFFFLTEPLICAPVCVASRKYHPDPCCCCCLMMVSFAFFFFATHDIFTSVVTFRVVPLHVHVCRYLSSNVVKR